MELLKNIFPVILYILLIILIIVLIVLVIRMIGTLKKVDRVVDDVNVKVNKLNGLFNIVDTAADTLTVFGDKIVSIITNSISKFFSKKKKKKEDDEDE